jgi:hypothetical protein
MLFKHGNCATQRRNPTMLRWLSRLLTPAEPEPPRHGARITHLENLVEDLESRLEYVSSEMKKIRGRQFSFEKRLQDDPGETIDERADRELLPNPPTHNASTAHLARRFRNGG